MRGARPPRGQAEGFTLIELMTVVTIVAVLAAIGLPTFQGYVQKSRTSEATQFLGVIKLRQEAYRSEFGQYAQIAGVTALGAIQFAPRDHTTSDGMNNAVARTFPGTGNNEANWNQLGANPGGAVRFGYGIAAGLPASAPVDAPAGGCTVPLQGGRNYTPDHWFLAAAVSDLNGDGNPTVYEAYSQKAGIWYCPFRGWD